MRRATVVAAAWRGPAALTATRRKGALPEGSRDAVTRKRVAVRRDGVRVRRTVFVQVWTRPSTAQRALEAVVTLARRPSPAPTRTSSTHVRALQRVRVTFAGAVAVLTTAVTAA